MLVGINRHGARYAFTHLEDKEQHGMLTNNGIRMAYFLGKYLRQKYPTFFGKKFKMDDNYILASSVPRCQQTAQAIMMGIYDFGSLKDDLSTATHFQIPEWDGLDISTDFKSPLPEGYHPIPVHSHPKQENFGFQSYHQTICPKLYSKLSEEIPEDVAPMYAGMEKLLPRMKNNVFDYRTLFRKERADSLREWEFYTDYYYSQRYMGNDLGLNEATFLEMERLDAYILNYNYFRFADDNKYLITELGREFLPKLKQLKVDLQTNQNITRFLLLSGHDMNVYAMLVAANAIKLDCLRKEGECTLNPRFASIITLEVYEEQDQFYVESQFNGKQLDFCSKKGETDCTLNQFIEHFEGLTFQGDIQKYRDKYCLHTEKPKWSLMYFFVGFNVFVLSILLILIYTKRTVQAKTKMD